MEQKLFFDQTLVMLQARLKSSFLAVVCFMRHSELSFRQALEPGLFAVLSQLF